MPQVDTRQSATDLAEVANAAGMRAFVHHSQNFHGVRRGRAWVQCLAAGMVGRREGADAATMSASEALHPWSDSESDTKWAIDILATGRTNEVGAGVHLRDIQDAVYVHYETVDYGLDFLAETVMDREDKWNIDPDYQRDHVWTDDQRSKFVGYFLVVKRMPLIFLNYGVRRTHSVPEVVDGKQRLTSLLRFVAGEIDAELPSGQRVWWRDFDEVDRRCAPEVTCARIYLPSRAAVLQFYINLNAGGTVHTQAEIDRVRAMLAAELTK